MPLHSDSDSEPPLEFTPADVRRLKAAQGWVELGDGQAASDELENITPPLRGHPDVLKIRFDVAMMGKDFELAVVAADAVVEFRPDEPEGWLHRSCALHEMGCTAEALEKLQPAAEKFPDNWLVQYNLACYACQLGKLEEARAFLARATELGDADKVKRMALDDPGLAALFSCGA